MKLNFTMDWRSIKWIALLFHLVLTLAFTNSYAQTKNYATTATIATNVDLPNNATNGANTFATVRSRGATLILGGYTGHLELQFPTVLPANTTTYIRLDFDPDVLNALLGGNLGGLLADVLGNVILGDHTFEVGARRANGTTILSGTSSNGFSGSDLRLVKDAAGLFYVAITPNEPYNKVFLRDVTTALLLGGLNETKVYNAFYFSGSEACANGFATGFEGNGLTVDVLGVGKAGVTNPERAIDADQTNFSEISLGALGVAGSISQNIYFSTLSNPGDEFNVRLKVNPALLSAGLLNNTVISAYNGNTEVFSQNLNSLLTLDLLGLLNSGSIANVPFKPTLPFDRVKITLRSLVNAGLTQTVNLYSVFSSAPRPTFTLPMANTVNICYNSTATLSATTAADTELIWYEAADGGTAIKTTAYNESFVTPALTTNKTYYVAARRIGCTAESIRVAINVVVNPAITFATTTLANANVGTAYTKQINLATGGTPTITYTLASGSVLPAGIILSPSGQIGGTPTAAGDFPFTIVATDSKNCTATATFNLKVTPSLVLPPATFPNGTVATLYPTQIIPLATGGSGTYTYVATNLPPGLTFTAATREIKGTPTQSGPYVVNVVVTDADGNQASNNYTIVVKDPLVLPITPLADGTVGVAYQTQTLLPASGGTTPYTYAATNLPPGLSFNNTTREITGTPITAGTYAIPVTVTDAENRTKTENYAIRVQDPLSMPGKTLPDGNVNITYAAQTLPAANGGLSPYTYVATNLPNGLNFDQTTREITGIPTQAGNYTITQTATDAGAKTISNTYAIKVIGALNLPTANLPNGTIGTVYTPQTLPEVTGGTGPYAYLATNLPPGLGFNTTTREITGTPTQGGTFVVTLTATDAVGNVVSTNYSITVNVPAPVVANATVCSGSTATLSVTNLQNGVTYNWYGATGNTPLATNNNGTFTTPVVNANTTFYVEAVSGTGVSTRTAVNVNINPAPNAPTIITNNQIINSGQNTVLQASADAGETINWYANANGGTILATGPSFTTPNLTANTTYYAGTVNATGCASLSRSPVTVTVLNGGASPACNFANSQNSGITGLCLLCSISNPLNSTDADLTNFTRITLAVGVGAQGYQRLIFPSAGTATDSIRLDLATPTGLLDLNVLSGVTITVLNNGAVVNSYQLNSALIDLRLLGGNRFKATFLAGGVYDRVEVRFGATVAALSSLDIYSAEVVYPKPTVAATGLNICSGNTTTLTATPNGGTTLTWYDAANNGNVVANGTTFNTPALTATTIYYIEISKAGCANTERVPVKVNVTPVLAVPVIAAASATCEGAPTTLTVTNPDPAITYNWFEAANGGTSIFTGTSFTTPALTANKTYYVEATQNGCVSATRAAVNVTVNPRPAAPQVQASSSTINAGQTVVITATSPEANVNFNWYTSANGTTSIFTGATFVTPPLNSTTSYYVESVNTLSGCLASTRVQVTINVNGTPSNNPVPCEAALAQTNGVTGVLTILAGVSNPTLAIDDNTQTGSSLIIPVGLLGSVYQRLTFPTASTVGDTIKILITSPSKLLSASVLGSLQLTSYNAGVSNSDAVFSNDPLINLNLLSGNTQALLTFVPTSVFDEVEVRLNSGLLGALTSVNVNYAQHVLAKPTLAATSVSVCESLPATLTISNFKPGATYKWYNEAGVLQATTTVATYTTPAVTANTKYFVTVSSPTACESAKTEVTITVNPLPIAPTLLFENVNTCAGSNVILEIKNPIPGTTYKWYNNAGTYQAGLDGVTFNVAVVVANTTYTVEAVNLCGTSGRTTATITVGVAVDAPIVTPVAVTVNEGSPAVLTASSSTGGAVFNWYATSNSATILHTGATFVTPTLTTSTSYFVEAVVAGPCPASARTEVKITVIPNGTPITTPCGAATVAIEDGVVGVALLAGVVNPNLAIDNNTLTGSSLIMPVGAIGAYVYQRVGFTGGLSRIGDTLRIKLSSPSKLLSLAVLPSISIITYNGATSNADAIVINNPLIQLDLLSDGSTVTLSYVPTNTFDGVEIRLNSGLLGALTSVNFDYAQRINVAPQVTATTVTACQGSGASLSVLNPQAGVTYRWYLENVYQADGDTFVTPTTLTAGTYNYYVKAFRFGCESAPTKVVVTILGTPAPPVPVVGGIYKTCVGSPLTLSVQAVAGINFNWYDVNGNLLVLNNASYTTSANLAPGTYDFFIEAVNGNSCVSSTRTKITITVNPLAGANDIQVSGNVTICGSSTTILTAASTTVTNPIFTWYRNASLTDVAFTGATFTTPLLTSSTTYYVTVKGDDKCENTSADAKAVTITINPAATANDINLAGLSTICAGSTVTLTASSTTVTNPVFTWYRDASLTDFAFTGATFTTPALTANTTYYVTVKGDNKCENTAGNALSIPIIVNPIAVASDIVINGNTTICNGSTTTLNASSTTVNNPIFTWYNDANLTSVAFTGADFVTPPLTASKTYYVTIKGDNKCESSSANAKIVTITVNEYAVAADITANNANICAGSQVTLSASSFTVTNPVFTWYSDASLTVVAYVGPTYVVPALTTNTNFYVTVKGTNKCENIPANAKVVTVTVNALAGMTDIVVTGNATACAGSSAQLTASSPTVTNAIFNWYADAALTNLLFIGNSFTSAPLFVTTNFYVTVKGDNKCANAPGDAKVVTITVLPIATAADVAAADATICEGTKATLTASTATITNPTYTWYNDAALSSIAFVGASFVTPNLTTTTRYYLTIKGDNKCENSSSTARVVTVTVNEAAKEADIVLSTPTVICGSGVVTINASSVTVTNPIFTWYSDASLTAQIFVGPSFTTPNLTSNITYYVTVKGTNKCENTAANARSITVVVRPIATATDITVSGNTIICGVNTTILTASTTTVVNPIFTWYNDAALTSVAFTGSIFTTPVLNANTTYYVTVKGDNRCENTSANAKVVTITVLPIATAADVAAADATICEGTKATLTASTATITNPTYTWYNDAALSSIAFVGASFVTPNLTTTTRYYLTIKGDNKCENSSSTARVVTVTVNEAAKQADIVLSTPTVICGSGVVTINASSVTVTNPIFTWYSDASLTAQIFVGPSFTTPNLTSNTTYYVTVKGTNKCENTAANAQSITVVVRPIATATDITVSGTTTICGDNTSTLTASTTTVVNPIFTWYNDAALTSVAFTGPIFTTPVLNSNATYYVTVKGDNRCENTSANAKVVTITVNPKPINPVVASTGRDICSGQTTTLQITNPQTGVVYEWYTLATGGSVLFTGTTFTTPILNANVTYYVQAVGTGGCTNASGRVAVAVTVTARPTAPTVASNNVSVCTGNVTVLSVTNPVANFTYNWFTSAAGGTAVGNGANFTTPAITANITYYVEAAAGSCQSSTRTPISINALPVPLAPTSIAASSNPICSGGTTVLTVNNPDANLNYRWFSSSSAGTMLAEGISFTTPTLTTTTTYYVESVTKAGGCPSNSRTSITVNVLPVLAAPTVIVDSTTPTSITFTWSVIPGATVYEVSTNNGTTWANSSSGANTHVILGLQPGQTVTLLVRAKGTLDCQTSASSSVNGTTSNPFANDLFIPNTFTPNGDGKNDIFLAYGNTVSRFKMRIYNQWGEYLFESNSLTTGWDGRWKGNLQPSGVYVYYIDVTFNDGTTKMLKGTVTLLR